MPKYDVLRPHIGDKSYKPGDIREAKEGDVEHLVKKGVLAAAGAKAAKTAPQKKVGPKPANKADQSAQNKAG
ncbi:hypothetical protein [Aliihoeflea sp. PC F10.4]